MLNNLIKNIDEKFKNQKNDYLLILSQEESDFVKQCIAKSNVVFTKIDRLNDPVEHDSIEKVSSEILNSFDKIQKEEEKNKKKHALILLNNKISKEEWLMLRKDIQLAIAFDAYIEDNNIAIKNLINRTNKLLS